MNKDQIINEMRILEQNLQNLFIQRQTFQMELDETQSALTEIEKSGDEIFKVIGQLMIKTEKSKVKEELFDKEKILNLRIKSIEKQEVFLTKQLDELREKIMKTINS